MPGFLPGVQQEHGGIIRHGAKMLFAYSAATVPKITVILRKCYGGAYLAMCGKDLGADRVFAWPTAEVAVMGAEGAAEIVFRKEIQEAEDKAARRKELIERYREAFSNPYVAAGRRLVDAVIEPALTRRHVAQALEYLHTKRELRPPKKHGLDAAVDARPKMTTRDHKRRELRSADTRYSRATGCAGGARGAPRNPRPAGAAVARRAATAAPLQTKRPQRGAPAGPEPIGEEELLAISAALAAYLGVRVHMRQIRLISSSAWAQQGRVSIQASHRLHSQDLP